MRLASLLLAAAALTATACRYARPAPKAGAKPAPRLVRTATVAQSQPTLGEELPAELSAYQDVQLQARVPGFIKMLYVDRGSRVQTGELLALLDAPDLVAQRAEAEHRLSSAHALELEATATLERDQVTLGRLRGAAATVAGAVAGNDIHVAEESVAADQAEVASRQAAEAAAQEALNQQTAMAAYLRVVAPFRGTVIRRSASEGALAGPNAAPLFELQQLDPLRLVVDVPEAEAVGMDVGARLPFTVSSQPERRFIGAVARIAHSVRRETRTMPVELDVANADLALAPGMFAKVRWSFHRDRATMFVPYPAVARTSERTFVEVVGPDQRLRWVDVTTGFSNGDAIEVFGGLRPGDRVVVPADDELRPGTAVAASGH